MSGRARIACSIVAATRSTSSMVVGKGLAPWWTERGEKWRP
jgi:hypothetical protein